MSKRKQYKMKDGFEGNLTDCIRHHNPYDLRYGVVFHRVSYSGYSIDDALSKPARSKQNKVYTLSDGFSGTIEQCIKHSKVDISFSGVWYRLNVIGMDINEAILSPKKIKTSINHNKFINKRIGSLTVFKYDGYGIFKCKCDCGKIVEKSYNYLNMSLNRKSKRTFCSKECRVRDKNYRKNLYGDLILDRNLRLIFSKNGQAHLTRREFELFCFIADSNGVALKEEIADKVFIDWGEARFTMDNSSISTHITNIRKKLKETGTTTKINNIKSVGYFLSAEIPYEWFQSIR